MSVQWAQTIFGGGGRADLKGLNKVVAKGLESSPLCTFCSFMSPAPAQVREGLVHGVLVWVYKRQMCFNTHHCSSVLLYAHKLLHAHRPLTFLWSLWVSLIFFFFFLLWMLQEHIWGAILDWDRAEYIFYMYLWNKLCQSCNISNCNHPRLSK